MCGCVVKEIPTGPDGDVDMAALEAVLGPNTAGIMLTNPSTLGVFERHIKDIASTQFLARFVRATWTSMSFT
jgi:glycine dehydrogenase subunit 2